MSLYKLPFQIQGDRESETKPGTVYVDPSEITMVIRGFNQITVVLKSGQMVHSEVPRQAASLVVKGGLHHLPDDAVLDRWCSEILAARQGVALPEGMAS